jgi:hypothetical protein
MSHLFPEEMPELITTTTTDMAKAYQANEHGDKHNNVGDKTGDHRGFADMNVGNYA